MINKKRLITIDILKYICAVMVVFLHVVNVEKMIGISEKIKNILFLFTQFLGPVEFFFISSSFLFFKKNPDKNAVKKYIKRIIFLYIFYSFFYINSIIQNFANRSIIYNIASIIKQYFIVGYSSFSWYIPSLLFGVIFVYLLKKYVKNKYYRCGITIIVTIIALLGTSYSNIFSENIQKVISIFPFSLIRAVIYIFLGDIVYNEVLNSKIGSIRKNFMFWCLFFILQLIERYLLKIFIMPDNFDITIFKIFGAYYMLKTLISLNQSKFNLKFNTSILGKASVVIYFLHMFILEILGMWSLNAYLEWGIIIIVLSILTFLIDKLSRKNRLQWLKNIT